MCLLKPSHARFVNCVDPRRPAGSGPRRQPRVELGRLLIIQGECCRAAPQDSAFADFSGPFVHRKPTSDVDLFLPLLDRLRIENNDYGANNLSGHYGRGTEAEDHRGGLLRRSHSGEAPVRPVREAILRGVTARQHGLAATIFSGAETQGQAKREGAPGIHAVRVGVATDPRRPACARFAHRHTLALSRHRSAAASARSMLRSGTERTISLVLWSRALSERRPTPGHLRGS